MAKVKSLYCNVWHCHLTLTDCEVQGIGIRDESCSGPCTPQAGDGGSKKRETQTASDPTNHVAIGLVLLQCEQGGKAFVKKNCCLLAHASRCGKDQSCKVSSFDYPDLFFPEPYVGPWDVSLSLPLLAKGGPSSNWLHAEDDGGSGEEAEGDQGTTDGHVRVSP